MNKNPARGRAMSNSSGAAADEVVERRPQGQDGRTVRVVSGRGYRYVLPFPYKLHEMLEEVEKAGGEYIVSWVSDGKAFKVHQPDQFVKKIVPLYFKQKAYKSFQRQLHLYGFQRVNEGAEKGSYFHKCFVREDRNLCHQMIRKMVKTDHKAAQAKKGSASTAAMSKKKHNKMMMAKSQRQTATPSLHQVVVPPSIKSSNDNLTETTLGDFDMSQHLQLPMPVHLQNTSPSVSPSVPANVFQDPTRSHRQGNDLISASNLPESYSGTISWLLEGGVSLPELASVLNVGGETSTTTGTSKTDEILSLSPTPMIPSSSLPSNSNKQEGSSSSHTTTTQENEFAQDVISIFGNTIRQIPPMPEILNESPNDITPTSTPTLSLDGRSSGDYWDDLFGM